MNPTRRLAPLLASTAISVAGDGAFLAATPLLAASLTRDPVAVSAVTTAFYLPWLLFGLPAGALADRWRRRTTMLAADLTRTGLLGLLTVLIVAGRLTMPVLVLLVVLTGVAQTLFDSAAQAFIPSVVGRDKEVLTQVNGRFWALDVLGRSLVGPPLGSLAFVVRHAIPFAVDAVSFALSAALVRRLPPGYPTGHRHPLRKAIRDGLRHLFATQDLRVLAFSTCAYNFGFNLAIGTFVLYVTEVLRAPEWMYGVLLAAGAVGGSAAGWAAPAITRRMSYRQTTAAALLGQAVGWAAIAATHRTWLAAAAFMLIGACSCLSSVAVGSARQALTPDGMLGRVVAAFRLFSFGAAGVGALAGGVVANQRSLTTPLVVAALLLTTAGAVAALAARGTRRNAVGP